MKLQFTKMHGCGNDYIYFDCFKQKIADPEALSRRLSRYHFGIGGDGIILIEPSACADARMRIFNQDGSEGKMCGNGIRCVGKYLYDSGLARKEEIAVETRSGIRVLQMQVKDGQVTGVTVNMGQAELAPERIPVALPESEIIGRLVPIDGKEWEITCVSMGNPHCVVFCEDPDSLELTKVGPKFEKAEIFPEGVNTEFIRVIDRKTLQMRVWERGKIGRADYSTPEGRRTEDPLGSRSGLDDGPGGNRFCRRGRSIKIFGIRKNRRKICFFESLLLQSCKKSCILNIVIEIYTGKDDNYGICR